MLLDDAEATARHVAAALGGRRLRQRPNPAAEPARICPKPQRRRQRPPIEVEARALLDGLERLVEVLVDVIDGLRANNDLEAEEDADDEDSWTGRHDGWTGSGDDAEAEETAPPPDAAKSFEAFRQRGQDQRRQREAGRRQVVEDGAVPF